MRNIVEKIVIERRGALVARINMLDANDRVINTIKTTEMLAYNDYTIDRETIAELCGMTVDALNRFYYLDRTGYCKVIDYGLVLTEAEFTKKNCFEILLDAIQNGDIKITDDNDNCFSWDDEEENDDEYIDSTCIAYDRARGYYLEELVRNNMGQIDHISYVSNDDSTRVILTKEDLYIDGVELLDYYDDNDYAFKRALKSAIMRRTEGFQECFEDFRAFLGERTIGSKPKEEPVIIEIEEPVVSESKVVEIQSNKSPVVAKLEELMVKALEEGDFAKYDELEERLNRISK